jgi:hypothetical protein
MNMAGDKFKHRPDGGEAASDMKSSGRHDSSLGGNELRRASNEARTASNEARTASNEARTEHSGDGHTKISKDDYKRLDAKLNKLAELVVQRVEEKNKRSLEDMRNAEGLLRGFVDF